MALLFSYGTLQEESVQLATFGRLLQGSKDELMGFQLSTVTVQDRAFGAPRNLRRSVMARRTVAARRNRSFGVTDCPDVIGNC